MSSLNELIGLCWAYVALAIAGGIIFGGCWLHFVRPPRRLFGPQRLRAVPWRGADVLLLFFLTVYFIPLAVQSALPHGYPFFPLNPVLAFPFQMAAILLLPAASTDTRPYQLGLTTHRLPANLFLGYLAWLVLTPPVYALDELAMKIQFTLLPRPPDKHPLLELLQTNPGFLDSLMVVLAAVVVAPILEELLFRGLLQGWAARRRWGADATLVGAVIFALFAGLQGKVDKDFFLQGNPDGLRVLVEGLAPAVFILVMIPGYIYADRLLWYWLPQPGAGRTVYAVALVFAAIHANVWPSPIPLFLLGLGLGFLAYRTQSLVSSITVHALFNAIAVLGLLWSRAS